jgi:CheY-like chemotaxis protein
VALRRPSKLAEIHVQAPPDPGLLVGPLTHFDLSGQGQRDIPQLQASLQIRDVADATAALIPPDMNRGRAAAAGSCMTGSACQRIRTMGTILLIDDDTAFLKVLEEYVAERFGGLRVLTCSDPVRCLVNITGDLDLLIVDLEMPGLDGAKVLSYAVSKGMNKNRIVILSGRSAEYLHERFPMGSCLAVLNKYEGEQKKVLDMIFSALEKKRGTPDNACRPASGT